MSFFDHSDVVESRRDAVSNMVDRCTIVRFSGKEVFNADTGRYETPKSTVYPTPAEVAAGNPGHCKVKSKGNQARSPEAGQEQFTVLSPEVHVPAGTNVRDGDLIEVTASDWTPHLVGRVFRVKGFMPGSFDSAYRVPVEVYT